MILISAIDNVITLLKDKNKFWKFHLKNIFELEYVFNIGLCEIILLFKESLW